LSRENIFNPRNRRWTNDRVFADLGFTFACGQHYRMQEPPSQLFASPRDSFDARNCAAAHETERIATILLRGTKTQRISFTKLPIETGSPPIPPSPLSSLLERGCGGGSFSENSALIPAFCDVAFLAISHEKVNRQYVCAVRLSRRFFGNGIVCFPLYAGSNGIVRIIRNLASVASCVNQISLRCNGCILCIRRESVSDSVYRQL